MNGWQFDQVGAALATDCSYALAMRGGFHATPGWQCDNDLLSTSEFIINALLLVPKAQNVPLLLSLPPIAKSSNKHHARR